MQVSVSRPGDQLSPQYAKAVADGQVRILDMLEAVATAGVVRSAQAMEIPRGSVQLFPPIPDRTISTVGETYTVVANQGLSPDAVYAIASVLTHQFDMGDQWNSPGEFPNFIDRQPPSNADAQQYYSTGSIPWQYEHLPPVVADSFFSLLFLGSSLLIVASLWSLLLPEAYTLWSGVIQPRAHSRFLRKIEKKLKRGEDLSHRDRRHLNNLIDWYEEDRTLMRRTMRVRDQVKNAEEREAKGA